MTSAEQLWAAFLEARPGVAGPQGTYSSWHFCDNQADADELVELVLSGRKRATAGALWSYEAEDEPLPRAGDFSVITDWRGALHRPHRHRGGRGLPRGRRRVRRGRG